MQAPARVYTAPGLKIDVAFHQIGEMGGDFCFGATRAPAQARWRRKRKVRRAPTPLLGAAEAPDGDTPCELLAYLNRVPGIATCRRSTHSISRLW